MKFVENQRRNISMMNKKSFLIGVATGVLALAAIEGIAIGGRALYVMNSESQLSDVVYDPEEDDDYIEESTGVFADNGNPIITDVDEKFKIEVVPPSGYTFVEDYESAYGADFMNEDQSIGLSYSIDNYTMEEMQSYYEFEIEFFAASEDVTYTNVSSSDVITMKVNDYDVNYISLSYTYDESEDYIEYCAYVMLDDATEFMCTIYGLADDINEDMIKACFDSQIPVTR